jgi:hypothetical protein
MPTSNVAAVVCEQPLEYEYREGLFYITDPTLGVRKVMRPRVFFQSIAAAAECSRQHRPWERSAEIIDFAAHQAATSK